MIEIISGTDRPGSNTLKVAQMLRDDFLKIKASAGLLDLAQLNFQDAVGGDYAKGARGSFLAGVERVSKAEGLIFVVPEYNGSFPGALKLFIDYWRYPLSFESRPMAFVGLGLRWGGLRPVEHLQQVMGYRNAYIFPHRVFISNVKDMLKDGKIQDPVVAGLLQTLSRDFLRFVRALQNEGLDANSKAKSK